MLPVPLGLPDVVVLGVVAVEVAVLGVAPPVVVVLEVVVLGVVALALVVLEVVAPEVTEGGGMDRKLVASGPATWAVPKVKLPELPVVRVTTSDELDTPLGTVVTAGASALATGGVVAAAAAPVVLVVGVVAVVVAGVVVVVVGVVVVVVGVVVVAVGVAVVVVGVVVVVVGVVAVVVGVVMLGVVAVCASTSEAAESAIIEPQASSAKRLVSCIADLLNSIRHGNITSFPFDPNTTCLALNIDQ